MSKDAEIEGFKEDNEGPRVQLLHSNNLTIQKRDLIKESKNMNVINDILKKKLVSVENQTNYYHTYQCSMCEFDSGHRDKVTDHMNKNHKKAYEAEETYGVDCMCKKLFYDQEDLEKHEKEHSIKCGICGACMNLESPELRYCVLIGHLEGPYFEQYLENILNGSIVI